MARGINKVILVGYLGAEPDMRRSSQDTPICNISLATTEGWRDVNGQVQTRTEWHRCVFFKHLAEVVAQFLHKGSLVYVEGRLSTRKWVDQQNVTHYTTEIIGTEMQMLSSIRQQGGGEFSGASSGDDYSQQGGGDDPAAAQGSVVIFAKSQIMDQHGGSSSNRNISSMVSPKYRAILWASRREAL